MDDEVDALFASLCLLLAAVLNTAYASDQDLLTVADNYTSELNDSALGLALAGRAFRGTYRSRRKRACFLWLKRRSWLEMSI